MASSLAHLGVVGGIVPISRKSSCISMQVILNSLLAGSLNHEHGFGPIIYISGDRNDGSSTQLCNDLFIDEPNDAGIIDVWIRVAASNADDEAADPTILSIDEAIAMNKSALKLVILRSSAEEELRGCESRVVWCLSPTLRIPL